MNKEIPLYGILLSEYWETEITGTVSCMFTDENRTKCNRIANWLHQGRRIYCDICHEIVNKINKERIQEANKKLKENINNWIYSSQKEIQCEKHWQINKLKNFQDKLKNGDFDE